MERRGVEKKVENYGSRKSEGETETEKGRETEGGREVTETERAGV